MDGALSKSERETLKAVFRLAKDGEGAHTGELAAHLGVSPGTATATVKRLAGRGLLDHRPYRGVELTKAGRREAAAAMRRHRIVERFLADMLGYAWNEADRLAGSFEHELPQEVEDRMYVALDRPATCPHGFPIPELDTAEIPDMPPLYQLVCGPVCASRCSRSIRSTVPWSCRSMGAAARWARRSPARSTYARSPPRAHVPGGKSQHDPRPRL